MIETPTTLILGAGASQPYGYPVGNTLKDKIISSLEEMVAEDNGWVNELGIDKDIVRGFISNFDKSKRPSIDSFLKRQKPEFTEIGKLAIVDIISKSESVEKLYHPPGNRWQDKDDWYRYLVQNLYECEEVDQVYENIRIITYNYDRSLEKFLFEPLMATFPLQIENTEECAEIINKIPITHMYGRLDPLPWENEEKGKEYGASLSSTELLDISRNIHLIDEAKDLGTIRDANEHIKNSERIYFLGLDIYRNIGNINLLNTALFKDKQILVTAYGLEQGERAKIQTFFRGIQNGLGRIETFKSEHSIRHGMPF